MIWKDIVLVQDVRFSLRMLRQSPSFTVVAVVTLAVTIAANAVVFGVMNGFILRPLDLPAEDSLYSIEHATSKYHWQFPPEMVHHSH